MVVASTLTSYEKGRGEEGSQEKRGVEIKGANGERREVSF